MVLCKWIFIFKNAKNMTDEELDSYQHLLLYIRDRFNEKVKTLSDCSFYDDVLPPIDNIFGTFLYNCKRHTPKCKGWYLIWNPNLDLNKEKLNGNHMNKCATWEYKAISKRIQLELAKAFPNYFELVDDDDTHPYFIDSYYNINNSTKSEDELFEDTDDSRSISLLSSSLNGSLSYSMQ